MHTKNPENNLNIASTITILLGFDKVVNYFLRKLGENIMSRHPSLKGSTKIVQKRNVLKRYERINLLTKDDRWKEGNKVLGLPKTKVIQ